MKESQKTLFCGSRCQTRQFYCLPGCRSRADTLLLFSVSGLLVSLFIAFALPAIVQHFLDEGIAEQVVMTPDNPNLDAWETNTDNESRRRRLDGDSTVDVSTDNLIHYDLYFFNVTNPEEAMNGAIPKVSQQGPYAHDEYYQKFDVSWSDDEEEVSFLNYKYYVYSQERSGEGLSDNDEITLINPVVTGFQYLMQGISANTSHLAKVAIEEEMSGFYQKVMSGLSEVKDKLEKRKIREVLLKKYIKELDAIMAGITLLYDELDAFIDASDGTDLLLKVILGLGGPMGISPFMQKKPGPAYFGWLNDTILLEVQSIIDKVESKTNASIPWTSAVPGSVANYTSKDDVRRRLAPTVIKTGKGDPSKVGDLVYYQGMSSIYGCTNAMKSQNVSQYKEGHEFPACENFDPSWNSSIAESKGWSPAWETPEANSIHGSYGELFGPPVSDSLTDIFIGDIYRGAYLEHTADIDWYGVNLYRLTIQEKDMQNATVYPPNGPYYSDGPKGLLNMTSATGAPVFGSYPHFLLSDERLVDAIDGIDPNYAEHMTYLDVEPNTGLLACARKQLQTNYFLTNQSFPATTFDFKSLIHAICANISTLLVELHKDPLPCGKFDQVDVILDILATPSGWKLNEKTLMNNGVYFPYGWSSESTTLPEDDAVAISSSVYAAQDFEAESFEWGLICTGIFSLTTIYLVGSRYAAGESLTTIFCGGGELKGLEEKHDQLGSIESSSDIQTPLISERNEIRESQI